MHTDPTHASPAAGPRFERWPLPPGPERYRLEGDARPGDVLALAGGRLVHDVNANGLVDGHDAPVEPTRPAIGALVDVRG